MIHISMYTLYSVCTCVAAKGAIKKHIAYLDLQVACRIYGMPFVVKSM